MKTEQAISATSAATNKAMEPHLQKHWEFSAQIVVSSQCKWQYDVIGSGQAAELLSNSSIRQLHDQTTYKSSGTES